MRSSRRFVSILEELSRQCDVSGFVSPLLVTLFDQLLSKQTRGDGNTDDDNDVTDVILYVLDSIGLNETVASIAIR